MAMSRNEILEEVKEVLIDALGLDDDEVTEEATLMGDLGAGQGCALVFNGLYAYTVHVQGGSACRSISRDETERLTGDVGRHRRRHLDSVGISRAGVGGIIEEATVLDLIQVVLGDFRPDNLVCRIHQFILNCKAFA